MIDVRNPSEIEEQGFIDSKRRVNIPIAELGKQVKFRYILLLMRGSDDGEGYFAMGS